MAGETADRIQNSSKLVQYEKRAKVKKKGITWLNKTEDGAHRKTLHLGSR